MSSPSNASKRRRVSRRFNPEPSVPEPNDGEETMDMFVVVAPAPAPPALVLALEQEPLPSCSSSSAVTTPPDESPAELVVALPAPVSAPVASSSIARAVDFGWQETRPLLTQRATFLLDNPRMSDVRFVVGESKTVFHGHRTILAMGSPVFEAQFFGSFEQSAGDCMIELPEFEPNAFRVFLKYLYTDKLELEEEVDEEEILNLLKPAKKYIVPHLIDKCCDILMNELKPENVFHVYNYAEFFQLPRLKGACLRFMDRETRAVIESEEFINLDREKLTTFLRRNGLNINEIEVFKAVLKWAEFQCSKTNTEVNDGNIRQILGDIIYLVRFPTMTSIEFATDVATKGILTSDEAKSIFIYMCSGNQNRMDPAFIPLPFSVTQRNFVPRQYLANRFVGEPQPHTLNYKSGEIYSYRFHFKTDKQIYLRGVNIFPIRFGSHPQYADFRRLSGTLNVYECFNHLSDRELGRDRGSKHFFKDGPLEPEFDSLSGTRYFPVLLDEEVRVQPNQLFTISVVVSVKVPNPSQYVPLDTMMGGNERSKAIVQCSEDMTVNFTFSHCVGEVNVGRYTQSQIPEIVFSL